MITKEEKLQILQLIKEQVVPAIGCTEPIAVALCVAKATELLGQKPEHIELRLSANILKNAMGVGIPGTGMVGLPIAIALGALIGRPELELEVLRDCNREAVEAGKAYIAEDRMHIALEENDPDKLFINVIVTADGHEAEARIKTHHTNFVYLAKDGQEIKGRREFVRIDIEGLQSIDHFRLSLGALDEFLSASVDQFLFEKDLANYTEIFKDRDFYPYSTFDEIQKYYGLRLGSREMIVVTYYVLHSPNPAVQLIEILERLQQDGPEELEKAPEEYMNKHFSIFTEYNNLINELDNFVEEARSSKRHLAAHLLSYYQDRFITANVLAKKDPLFFIRPFLIDNLEDIWQRQEFWIGFNRIRTCFPEPLMIQGKEFVTTRPCEYGADLTVLALAIYEIIESLEKNKVAKRLDHYKNRYNYLGDDDNCDDVASFGEPPLCAYWHRALNELGLYEFYRKNVRI